mgnify:CR=1 FL=1
MKYEGSCHCGKIAYEAEGTIDALIECNCPMCSRRGYLLWFIPRDRVKLKTPESAMSTYTFNKHIINHNFCPECGCAPVSFGKDAKGNLMAEINARCIQNVDITQYKITHFDGRST